MSKGVTQPSIDALYGPEFIRQALDVRGMSTEERERLIVSMRKVDASWVIVNVYSDDVWQLPGRTTNSTKANNKLDFLHIPESFRKVTKAMMYRMMRRGRGSHRRTSTASLYKLLSSMKYFFIYLQGVGVHKLRDCTPTACSQYVHACKNAKPDRRRGTGKAGLSKAVIYQRLAAVEAIYELSQHSDEPMERHPWPDQSADYISGYGRAKRNGDSKTPLMPDDIFEKLFQGAWSIVAEANRVLDLRDHVSRIDARGYSETHLAALKNEALAELGWKGGLLRLRSELQNIRSACYVVVASVSGCRNHELSFLRQKAYYSTEDPNGEIYWWMSSRSTKTGASDTQWMIPEAAVIALKIMDRWAQPYQVLLQREIAAYRSMNPSDVRIAEAQEHLGSIFVGVDMKQSMQVRTIGASRWNAVLKRFARSCGVEWQLSTHHFRRKFANYAARSQFGDLRYLKEHFKHWALDMTLHYALNDTYEVELYAEIEAELNGIKERVVGTWLDTSEPLAGRYGSGLVNWRTRSENVTLFKSHAHMVRSVAESTAIRSNGHAWCTADDNLCVGNDLEPTRCAADCGNSVIGREFAPIYQRLYDDLLPLQTLEDIGEGGRARVSRDLARCRQVLIKLGYEPAGGNQ